MFKKINPVKKQLAYEGSNVNYFLIVIYYKIK